MGNPTTGIRRPVRSSLRTCILVALCVATTAAGAASGAQRRSAGEGTALPALFSPLGAQEEAVALIDEAQRASSVALEVYELGNPEVVHALDAAVRRGVRVRVVLCPTERESEASAPELRAAGVAVRTLRVRGGIDHVKLLVVSGPGVGPRGAGGGVVLFGGVNFGRTSRFTTDLDVAEDGAWAKEAEAVFDADWAAAGGRGSPAVGRYGAFASGGAAIEASLAGALGWAQAQRRASCDVVANYLTDYWVQDALVAAAHDGVALNVVVNPAAYGEASASRWLEHHGVTVLVAPERPYLHAKVLVCAAARRAVAVVGSANFSYDAMHANHELDATLSGRVAEAVWRWAERVVAEARRPGAR